MMRRLPLLLPLLLLSGCGANMFNGAVYRGAATGCGEKQDGALTLGSHHFAYAPNQGAIVIEGAVDKSGKLSGSYKAIGADHKPYVQSFQGQLAGDTISGTLTKPGCQAVVVLTKG